MFEQENIPAEHTGHAANCDRTRSKIGTLGTIFARVVAVTVTMTLVALLTSGSDVPAPFPNCNDDADSLALDLSSLRPDWYPKERQFQEYSAYADAITPSLNSENNSVYTPCGDERRFVLIRPAESGVYSRIQTIMQSKEYEVLIFIHNGNTSDHKETEPSHGTRVSLRIQDFLYEPQKLTATIQSENALPVSVESSAIVQPELGIDSTYLIIESAAYYNSAGQKLYTVPVDKLRSGTGTLIGCSADDGEIAVGCRGSVRVKVRAMKLSRYIGLSVGDSPSGPWRNTAILDNKTPTWLRFRFVNVGDIPLEDVNVAFTFNIKFPWRNIYRQRYSYFERGKLSKQSLSLAKLVNGVEFGTVAVGETIDILIPISLRDGWQDALCSNGSTEVASKTRTKNYFDGKTRLPFRPSASLCK